MRVIEKIINYLRDNDFSDYPRLDNAKKLSVRDTVDISSDKKYVYLWGHCIFTLDKENNIKFSFQGWQTSTTKGRINDLLSAFYSCSAGIYQKNYQLVFSSFAGEFPIFSDKIYTIKNGKPEEVESI